MPAVHLASSHVQTRCVPHHCFRVHLYSPPSPPPARFLPFPPRLLPSLPLPYPFHTSRTPCRGPLVCVEAALKVVHANASHSPASPFFTINITTPSPAHPLPLPYPAPHLPHTFSPAFGLRGSSAQRSERKCVAFSQTPPSLPFASRPLHPPLRPHASPPPSTPSPHLVASLVVCVPALKVVHVALQAVLCVLPPFAVRIKLALALCRLVSTTQINSRV